MCTQIDVGSVQDGGCLPIIRCRAGALEAHVEKEAQIHWRLGEFALSSVSFSSHAHSMDLYLSILQQLIDFPTPNNTNLVCKEQSGEIIHVQ